MPNSLVCNIEYLPAREALLIQLDMSEYLIDYYIHRGEFASETTPEQDQKLKELIACFAVHLGMHRATQSHAWTLHMISDPPFSLFVTGAIDALGEGTSDGGYLVGNVLTDHIRHTDVNSFHAQFTDSVGQSFKSYVQSESGDVAQVVEHFYRQSEQQPLRIALSGTNDTAVALAALPGYDQSWFESAELDALSNDQTEQKKPMRTLRFNFACDCSPEKLLPFFRSIPSASVDELYGVDEELVIICPRCAKSFRIPRGDIKEE
ncbi:MAG: Hsp33 family molecular chaperone HslO [Bdellovibrionota bacterium]